MADRPVVSPYLPMTPRPISVRGNPMDPLLEFPLPQIQAGSLTTGGPVGRYLRQPQNAKFFVYEHQIIPGTTTGWVANATGIRDTFQIDGDALFAVMKQSVLSFTTDAQGGVQPVLDDTAQFEVSPVSEAYNFTETFLSNYGSGRFPNALQAPILLPRSAVYTLIASNRSGVGPPTIRFAHHGAKVYQNAFLGRRLYSQVKPFTYTGNFTAFGTSPGGTIAASGTAQYTLRVDGDSDFDVRRITIVSEAPITVQIRTDDDNWFIRPLRSELLGGSLITTPGAQSTVSGELPFFLTVPRLVSAAAYINITATNTDTTNAIQAQVVLWGNRLYPAGGASA